MAAVVRPSRRQAGALEIKLESRRNALSMKPHKWRVRPRAACLRHLSDRIAHNRPLDPLVPSIWSRYPFKHNGLRFTSHPHHFVFNSNPYTHHRNGEFYVPVKRSCGETSKSDRAICLCAQNIFCIAWVINGRVSRNRRKVYVGIKNNIAHTIRPFFLVLKNDRIDSTCQCDIRHFKQPAVIPNYEREYGR